MSRQVGDERGRYGRKGLGERVEDMMGWPGDHPVAMVVLLAFVAVALLLVLARGQALRPGDLAVGDCLFVPTDAAGGETRPIGDDRVVAATLLSDGAERAACDASHGHEVSAVTPIPLPTIPTDPSIDPLPGLLDRASIERLARPVCERAFVDYVGMPSDESIYATFPVFPDPPDWVASGRGTICLVARDDGGWMDRPARASKL
jgi:hypothetical protein